MTLPPNPSRKLHIQPCLSMVVLGFILRDEIFQHPRAIHTRRANPSRNAGADFKDNLALHHKEAFSVSFPSVKGAA